MPRLTPLKYRDTAHFPVHELTGKDIRISGKEKPKNREVIQVSREAGIPPDV